MSKVLITRSKLDDLASAISVKSGASLPLTLAQMQTAVENIPTGGGTLITKSIIANGTYDAEDDNADGYSSVTVNVPSGTPTLQAKSVSVTPTEYAQSQTVTAGSGYDGLSEVGVSVGAISTTYVGSQVPRLTLSQDCEVNPSETRTMVMADGEYLEGGDIYVAAIPSTYVGSDITRRSSSDLTVSGATVTAPAGYYESAASASVASGTAGTPTATKGSVSNHSVSVTPSVTNTAGYIPGGTKTGTAVTVSASELVSGSQTITQNNTYDVTNLQSVTVNVSGGAATLVPYAIRPDAELVQSYTFDQHAVADMGLTIPSYTTTAKTLKAAANLSPTVTMDMYGNYRYTVVERFLTIPEYSVSTKARGRQEYTACSYIYDIVRIAANEFQAIIDATKKIASPQYLISTHMLYRLLYWSSSSALAIYASNSYGAYMTPTPPAVSASSLIVKAPAFGIRGSTTYYANTYMNATTDIRYQYVIEVYRSPVGNLNIDGWGQEQSVQHIIDCVNGSTHTLT